METGPLNLDEIEARANAATPGPWSVIRHIEGAPAAQIKTEDGCVVSCNWEYDATFIAAARTDVPALIARVRELEDHAACLEALLREKTEEADELDDERREAWAHIHEHASARSHLILKDIHGALTDALPNTPIPALDSFDVVEMVRNVVAERDQALADYQDLGRVMHEECSRLEAECERMKTFAAKSFSQMMCQEVEQMREYGLSYEGVRKVLGEYNDGEISFGKLMDLIRAAARAMAEPVVTYSEGETLLRAQVAEAQQLAKQMMDERDEERTEVKRFRDWYRNAFGGPSKRETPWDATAHDTGAPCDGHRHCCADRRKLAEELLRVRAERDALRDRP